jgi:hypothetical protein
MSIAIRVGVIRPDSCFSGIARKAMRATDILANNLFKSLDLN